MEGRKWPHRQQRCSNYRSTRNWYVCLFNSGFTALILSTGKSVFLWYLAIRLLRDYPNEPLLIVQPNITLLFYRGASFSSAKTLDNDNDLPNPSIYSTRRGVPSCLALVDWNQKSEPSVFSLPTLVCIFAPSPDQSRYKDWAKRNFPYRWGIPTWDRKEIREG